MREHGGGEGEHIDETVISGGAKRRHLSQLDSRYYVCIYSCT